MTKLEMIEREIFNLEEKMSDLYGKRSDLLNEKVTVKLRITAEAKMKLEEEAREKGKSMGEIVKRMILGR